MGVLVLIRTALVVGSKNYPDQKKIGVKYVLPHEDQQYTLL